MGKMSSLDDVVHHLIEFTLALAGSELRDHVLLVLQAPLLHLRLVLLLLHSSASQVVHPCLPPLHHLAPLHHGHQILPG